MNALRSHGKINGLSAIWIVAAFLFASALAVSPQLHEKLHKPSANHECVVTLIASGKYEHSAAPPLVFAPQPAVSFSKIPALHPIWVAAPFLGASIFEHAPPALS